MKDFVKVILGIIVVIGLAFVALWLYAFGFNYMMEYFEFGIKRIGIFQAFVMMLLLSGGSLISFSK